MSNTKTKITPEMNYNSGALFSTPDPQVKEGPFTMHGDKAPNHRIRMTLGKPGEEHQLEVFKRGKDGKAVGKPVGLGSMVRNPNSGVESKNGNLPPLARGTVTFAKGNEVSLNLWRTQDGTYYQLKPNTGLGAPMQDDAI